MRHSPSKILSPLRATQHGVMARPLALTLEQMATMRQLFDRFDRDNNGSIDRSEFQDIMAELLNIKAPDETVTLYIDQQFQIADKGLSLVY